MARPDARKIKDEAAQHVARSRWKKALECYLQLEKLESDGTWPQRAGEMHRRLGQTAEAAAAFTRSADVFSGQGFLLKGIAACKLILDIDPRRTGVQERLAALHAARLATQRPAGVIAAVAVAEPEPPSPPPVPIVPTAAPVIEVPLARVVPGARRSDQIASHAGSDVYEIPLDDEDIEVIEEPTASDAARALFPRTPLFSSLDEARLLTLIAHVELRRLAAGETLFRRGDPATALYVISSGEVSVHVAGPSGDEVERSRMGEGAFFGEIGLLVDQPRTATITAVVDTDLLVIDRATVTALVAESPQVLQVLLRFMRDRLIDSLVESNPLFIPFSGEDRRALAGRFVFLEADPGSVLLPQGAQATGLFVVLAGQLEVVRDDRPIDVLMSGTIFGEASLLRREPAPATIRARGKALLLNLPRADFQEVIMTHPQVLEQLSTRVV